MRAHISIERCKGHVWMAVLGDDFSILRDFERHECESHALDVGREWCAANGHTVERVVYPKITRMVVHRTTRKGHK